MDEFTTTYTGNTTYKSTDPSSSDERELRNSNKKEKVSRKQNKHVKRKKNKSSLKKTKSPKNFPVGWSVLAVKAVSEEDTEDPVTSEKSDNDTLVKAVNSPSSDNDADCSSKENHQIRGDVVKSISKRTKKVMQTFNSPSSDDDADSSSKENHQMGGDIVKSISKSTKKVMQTFNSPSSDDDADCSSKENRQMGGDIVKSISKSTKKVGRASKLYSLARVDTPIIVPNCNDSLSSEFSNAVSKEDAEEPVASEKSDNDTLVNVVNYPSSNDDADGCSSKENQQMGDVKSISKSAKKLISPQMTSTQIKKKRRHSNSSVQNRTIIEISSDGNCESPMSETVLNETFTAVSKEDTEEPVKSDDTLINVVNSPSSNDDVDGCSSKENHQMGDVKSVSKSTKKVEDAFAAALKELKFRKEEPKWTDAKSHTFCGVDIPPSEDEKRGTYNLEHSVIDLGTLKSLEDNEQERPKRSSIGQRMIKQNKRISLEKLSTTLKAKGKLKDKKSNISKQVVQGVLNGSKRNVTFNDSISSNNFTKIKRTKMPNFSKIHQRQMDRTESLHEYVQRTQERANILLSGGKKLLSVTKPATPKCLSTDSRKQLNFSPQPGCSKFDDGNAQSVNTKRYNVKTFLRMDAINCEEDVEDDIDTEDDSHKKYILPSVTPQKKRVTYSTPFSDTKSPKVFAKTPASRKCVPKTPDTEDKLPCKSPRVVKTSGKTFVNITPKKEATFGLATKLPRITPECSRKRSPRTAKTPKAIKTPTSETKTVLVKSPKSPIAKVLPLKLFQSKKRNLVNVVAAKNARKEQNKPDVKNATTIEPQPSTSTASSSGTDTVPKGKTNGQKNVEKKETKKPLIKKNIKPRPDKEALKIAANKSRVPKTEDVAEKREVVKGLRTNRRFDLLMKFRNKK